MKEKLIIRNFGPINSIELNLGKITVLIGKQASGKSTVVKVLAICRYFSYIVDNSNRTINYESNFVRTALKAWGLSGYHNENSFISYENEDYKVIIENHPDHDIVEHNDDGSPVFTELPPVFKPTLYEKSDRFKKLLEEYKDLLDGDEESVYGIYPEKQIPLSFFKNSVKTVMDNPFYFPTERGLQSIFSLGKTALENLSDSLYDQFRLLHSITSSFKESIEVSPLNIEYKYVDGDGLFKQKSDEQFMRLSQGASGYKSSIPIVLAILYYSIYEKRKRTFLIEEPEQNLFPETQQELIKFLVSEAVENKHQIVATTHSPYILTSLENLMYAHKLGTTANARQKVSDIITEKYWINPEEVEVYCLEDGVLIDLLDREEVLVDKEYLDSVSNSINTDFDKLLSIEIELEDKKIL